MGEGRGEEGRGGSITLLMLHMWRRNPATEALGHPSKLRASSSRVRVARAHIRVSGHTHCERFVRDIGRFCGGQSLLARSAPAAPVGGWPVVSGRTIMTASLQRTTLRAGRLGWGLGRYAQSTRGRDGRQTAERSQVRGFRRLWALSGSM